MDAPRARRSTGGAQIAAGGAPAAVLHTDGLWLTDGTCIEHAQPIVHVGQVAELAYAHHIGYQLTPKFSEPGQIWITEENIRNSLKLRRVECIALNFVIAKWILPAHS